MCLRIHLYLLFVALIVSQDLFSNSFDFCGCDVGDPWNTLREDKAWCARFGAPLQMMLTHLLTKMTSLLSFFTFSFIPTSAATLGAPRPWQRGFQTPASPLAEGIIAFHDDLRIFLVGILCFVRFILSTVISKYSYRYSTNGRPVERLVHASTLEIV